MLIFRQRAVLHTVLAVTIVNNVNHYDSLGSGQVCSMPEDDT
jgi:hypothetical protein